MEIKFKNREEQLEFEYYSQIKGKKLYKFFLNYFDNHNIDKNAFIEYKYISSLIKYDKKIKEVLYKYLSLFEEYIRALLIDNSIFKDHYFIKELNLNDLSSFNELSWKKYSLGKVIFLLKELELIDYLTFKEYKVINTLRNKVMHFDFLLLSFNKQNIYLDINKIEDMIAKLVNNLPNHYKNKLIIEINQAKLNLSLINDFKLNDF